LKESDFWGAPSIHVGPLALTGTVLTTWGIILALSLVCWACTRRLRSDPGFTQTALEGGISAMENAVKSVLPEHVPQVFPFIATLWIFIVTANLIGIIPGLHSPTRDLSLTAALAILVFLSVHWFGIQTQGLKTYLFHYLRPNPILLPFHLISEVTRTLALAVRLFGNMMSLEMAALLVLLVAGLLVPVPLLMLHIVEALVQAYIFGILALIYIAGGIHSQRLRQKDERSDS
jgi:F-type H+-transporting ATPase subunit a